MRIILLLALFLVGHAVGLAKMPVRAAYWAADRPASKTIKDHYPSGVIPGVVNRLILTHVKFQDFKALEASAGWKANIKEYKVIQRHGVEVWIMIANEQKAFLPKEAAPGYIRELVDFCVRNDIGGVDIDFEGEETMGHPNYNNFCRQLADALHAKGRKVSMAVHPHWTFPRVEDATLAKLDYVMAMAYDQYGAWKVDRPGPHSPFEYAQSCVAKVKARKVPASRILLGMPTYGYRWWNDGSGPKAAEFGWPALLAKYPGHRDKDQAGPGPQTAEGIWHYNGIATVRRKIQWANREQLAGIAVWHGNYEVKDPRNSFWFAVRDANQP